MSTLNPISFRFPFSVEGKAHPDIVSAVRYLASGNVDVNQAIAALKQQLDALTPSSTTTVIQSSGGTSGGGGTVFPFPGLGTVNDQIGVTAYTTQPSDNGAKIIVGDASPIAVTLNAGVATPWFCVIDNDSSAVANLSASSGVVNGANAIQPNGFGIVYFDGTNFWVGASSASTGLAYDIAILVTGTFLSLQTCMEVNVVRAFTLPASLTGSIAKLDTAATASTVFSITQNGTSIGSITFAASGTTGTFTFASPVTFAAGDIFRVIAPASPDATAAGLSVTFKGSR